MCYTVKNIIKGTIKINKKNIDYHWNIKSNFGLTGSTIITRKMASDTLDKCHETFLQRFTKISTFPF